MSHDYKCKTCGKTVKEEKAPACCGQTMELLPVCTTAPSAEQARPFNDDEPCDEGTTGERH